MQSCNCDEPDVVPVIDRNLAPTYISGNPYARLCRNCGQRHFCKGSFWEDSENKYVIPRAEGDEDPDPIPVEEYEDENYFECPKCGKPRFGEPKKCEACGVEYEWEDD